MLQEFPVKMYPVIGVVRRFSRFADPDIHFACLSVRRSDNRDVTFTPNCWRTMKYSGIRTCSATVLSRSSHRRFTYWPRPLAKRWSPRDSVPCTAVLTYISRLSQLTARSEVRWVTVVQRYLLVGWFCPSLFPPLIYIWEITGSNIKVPLDQGWRTFLTARAQIVYTFRRNSFRAHGNFEQENKVLEPSINIINYCIISINAYYIYIYIFSPGVTTPDGALASSLARFHNHIQRRATVGRTPLNEWSVRRRDLYLTTHNTHNTQTSKPWVGFEPTIAASERP